jgi:hypothetical protein
MERIFFTADYNGMPGVISALVSDNVCDFIAE